MDAAQNVTVQARLSVRLQNAVQGKYIAKHAVDLVDLDQTAITKDVLTGNIGLIALNVNWVTLQTRLLGNNSNVDIATEKQL